MNAKIYERATRAMLREARKLGKRKGEGAADVQYLPGGGRDTARDAAGRAVLALKEIDDDCPEWAVPPSWLSGEWADEPTVQDIAERCGVDPERDPDGEVASEVADAFVAAADAAWSDYLVRHLRNVAKGGR